MIVRINGYIVMTITRLYGVEHRNSGNTWSVLFSFLSLLMHKYYDIKYYDTKFYMKVFLITNAPLPPQSLTQNVRRAFFCEIKKHLLLFEERVFYKKTFPISVTCSQIICLEAVLKRFWSVSDAVYILIFMFWLFPDVQLIAKLILKRPLQNY